MNQQRISQASYTLAQTGNGPEFNRGVQALADMLYIAPSENGQRREPKVDRAQVFQSAQSLLMAGNDRDFQRGVLAMAASLLSSAVMMDLMRCTAEIRQAMPARELEVPFLVEATA